jgi:hypothetical protein
VTIVPVKFYRVVSYWLDVNQLSIRNGDKLPGGAVPLAKSARAVTPQVRFWIVPCMVIIPQNPDDALSFDVIDLGWESASHAALTRFPTLKLNHTVSDGRHATNLCAIH